jgi:hypothetical protein
MPSRPFISPADPAATGPGPAAAASALRRTPPASCRSRCWALAGPRPARRSGLAAARAADLAALLLPRCIWSMRKVSFIISCWRRMISPSLSICWRISLCWPPCCCCCRPACRLFIMSCSCDSSSCACRGCPDFARFSIWSSMRSRSLWRIPGRPAASAGAMFGFCWARSANSRRNSFIASRSSFISLSISSSLAPFSSACFKASCAWRSRFSAADRSPSSMPARSPTDSRRHLAQLVVARWASFEPRAAGS